MTSEKQCLSALRLRHHSKSVTAKQVLDKASRYARRHNWKRCKAAIKRARARDRQRKKK